MEFSYSGNCFLCDGNYLIVFSFISLLLLLLLYLTCQIVLCSCYQVLLTVVNSFNNFRNILSLDFKRIYLRCQKIDWKEYRILLHFARFCQIIFASLLNLSKSGRSIISLFLCWISKIQNSNFFVQNLRVKILLTIFYNFLQLLNQNWNQNIKFLQNFNFYF